MRFIALMTGLLLAHVGLGAVADKVIAARRVIVDRMASDQPIPEWVQKQTRCVAALKVVKVGVIWGGQGSTGMVSCRVKDTWSLPSFFTVSGVNFGIQIGVQFLESVLTFMTDPARNILKKPSIQLGADVSFAAGPVGEGSGTGGNIESSVLSYQVASGLYAGATVNGFVLGHRRRLNEQAYGSSLNIDLTPENLLATSSENAPVSVQPFTDALRKYFPAR